MPRPRSAEANGPGLARVSMFAAMLACAGLPIYIFAPPFYAAQYGVGLGAIGALLFGLRLVDCVQDPLLGLLADRLGARRRVAVLIGGGVLALGMLLLFATGPAFAPLWWLALSLLLLFSAYSFLTILFYAEGVRIAATLGQGGHVRLAAWRETGALLGVTLASVLPPALELVLPVAAAYRVWSVGFAVLVILALMAMAPVWGARSGGSGQASEAAGIVSLGALRDVLGEPRLRALLIVAVLNASPLALTATLFLFFVEFRLDAAALAGPLLLLFFVAAAVAAPLWSQAARRFGTVDTLSAAMVLAILVFGWAYTLGPGDTLAFAVICVASGAALGADLTLLPALFASRLEERDGQSGTAFGLWNFCAKFSLALAAGVALPLLAAFGFDPSGPATDRGVTALAMLYALLPCLLKFVALVTFRATTKEETA
ncbi:MFS transporter [Oceanomicrobium pacificus]|uniref:MFS transporter n=1 Tax=Oceanomicrobium pacificus TaxID=2692916 RepID=A0A6B0TYW0_9RHOB|nr:MFS transporter [Oceanomicrobium pacificus]MXU66214.1 MFS transporter [Oceanomicrobium pacificus]